MRILFFTPFSLRNGAEMMLWYLIKYASSNDFVFAVYSLHDGELLAELPSNVQYFVPPAAAPIQPLSKRIKNKLLNKVNSVYTLEEHIAKVHHEFKPDLWYVNTILCSKVTQLATLIGVPYVVHFHELLMLYHNVSYIELQLVIKNSKALIGCSEGVCEKLRIMGGENVVLQYECIDVSKVVVKNKINRSDIGIPDDVFVWVMSGSIEYRKGTDLIPAIAKAIGDKAIIIWLGSGSSGYSYYVEQEAAHLEVTNLIFLGAKSDDYYDYLGLADGLLLSSREDPFPLVMIEAAALGKPIVAFNSGGVSEFLEKNMGILVDTFNVEDIVAAMNMIVSGDVLYDRQTLIERAAEFDAKAQANLWQKSIKKLSL